MLAYVATQGVWGVYEKALRAQARSRNHQVMRLDAEAPASSTVADFVLCVVGCNDEVDAEERVRAVRKLLEGVPIVVLCAHASVDTAVRLMRLGVRDVVSLPASPESVARRAYECALRAPSHESLSQLAGSGRRMSELKRRLLTLAKTNSTVLLTGETGTGKGLVARVIHELSPRAERRFVQLDCAALSPTIIESELFGHERGAFTGAVARREGRFELASHGTIFLDEIGDLDNSLQSKLLRVLQDRVYERMGGGQTLRMQARVIAATNRDLLDDVRHHRFRTDLFFRLNVLRVHLPPLREHPEDIPELVRFALARLCPRLEVPVPTFSGDFIAQLASYHWPGNVRQLFHLLEQIMAEKQPEHLTTSDLNPASDSLLEMGMWRRPLPEDPSPSGRPPDAVGPHDRERLASLLVSTGGNIARAARRLGVPRSTLRYWIRRYGLTDYVPRD